MTLEADEFIRRFLLHTLPPGFQRIRHYGFLANCHRGRNWHSAANCWRHGSWKLLPRPRIPTRSQTAGSPFALDAEPAPWSGSPSCLLPLARHATGKYVLTEMTPRRFPPNLEKTVTPATHARTAYSQRPDTTAPDPADRFPRLSPSNPGRSIPGRAFTRALLQPDPNSSPTKILYAGIQTP